MLDRLEAWRDEAAITAEQSRLLAGLVREEPFSLFAELNGLLYVGVLAFVGGLGWTISTWSAKVGDVAVLSFLAALLVGCFGYCFRRGPDWSTGEARASGLVFDYVLYLGSLVWGLTLGYLETRFHVLTGRWDVYLLVTAMLFFGLAYRFDNRFVLSLGLSSLAGWFGFKILHFPGLGDEAYRGYALAYCAVVGGAGWVLRRIGMKAHFFSTYLNVVANVLFLALLSGVLGQEAFRGWAVGLAGACAASTAWGLEQRQFSFVVYAALYGYVGVSSLVVRGVQDPGSLLSYFVFSATGMLVGLVVVARRFGRSA